MRILCKGFNLYNQLNGKDKCIEDFQCSFNCYDKNFIFCLGHTFSLLVVNNTVKISCNLANRESLDLKHISRISHLNVSGDKVILILTQTGELFKTLIDNWELRLVPKFIDDNDKIEKIVSTSKLIVAYTKKGFLYNGPEKLDFENLDVVDIKTGREHCVLLDKGGNIYTFGAGSKGQLGNGQLEEQQNPALVQALAGIKILKIAAGGWHSTAISEEGDLYTWGWNGNGQLGLAASSNDEKSVNVMATPHVVDIQNCENLSVRQVACGNKHTIVLLNNNVLYGCGWNKYKQIKNEDIENYNSFIFIKDFSEENVDSILCGPWSSAVICE